MDKSQGFLLPSLNSFSIQLSFFEAFAILSISLLGGLYVRYLYWKFSSSFSSRISFGNTLLIVTISVASLVAVVKSSLALSLGLVGALSVVRFRTAVKEPFNLSFLLFSICIGISVGASQYLFGLMLCFFGTTGFFLAYRSTKSNKGNRYDYIVDDIDTIALNVPYNSSIDKLYSIFSENTNYYSVTSMDQIDNESISLVIRVKIDNLNKLSILKNSLFESFPGLRFSFYNSPSN